MPQVMLLLSLGGGLAGALIVTLADAWLSRLLLTYLDGIETNVETLTEALRTGQTNVAVAGLDLKRDRRLDRARHFKTLGWLIVVVAFALQLAAAWLINRTPS
jgi:hypothetical protein